MNVLKDGLDLVVEQVSGAVMLGQKEVSDKTAHHHNIFGNNILSDTHFVLDLF